MMKLFSWRISILCIQILFIPVLCQAQLVFGEYSEEELALEIVSFEPEAKIVALYEGGVSNPIVDAQPGRVSVLGIATQYHYRYKILHDNVLNFGDIRIPFTRGGDLNLEQILEIQAQVSYLENGQREVRVLSDEDIKLVKLDDGSAEYRLIFPNAKKGSILEWKYVKLDRVYYSLEGWAFQGTVPKLKTMFSLLVPSFLKYQLVVQGAQVRKAMQVSDERDTFIWELDSVRSFQTEPYILNPLDYLDRVEGFLSTDLTQQNSIVYSTWEELGTQIQSMKAFGSYFKKNSFKKINIEDDLTGATQLETAKNIYAFVSNQFELMPTVYPLPTQDFNSLLKSKKGNHLDINLLLLVVLQQYGVNANLVMINQKGENRTNLIPSPYLDQFSSSLVRVVIEGKLFWLDGTAKDIPFGLISPNKLMPKGFMIDGANSSLIPISLAHTSGFEIEIGLGKDSVNNLVYQNSAKIFGLSVQSLKEIQLNQEQEVDEEYSAYDVTFEDSFLEKEVVQSIYKLQIKESNDQLMVLTPFEQSIFFDNLFIAETRKYAVEFEYGFSERISFRLDIPEGYELDEYPESKSISMGSNELEFTFQVTDNDGVLTFESKVLVNQSEIPVSKYKDLRRFAIVVSEQLNSPIVLKKVH
ncbi:hypothetical protein [Algoriphagus aquimarinus]|uniref:DUF3857 domain-containing protein n=1 Tax=Algoriphagus aquimarinus TaxID=237018 RepID=A0A1I0VVA6_9BACT|nr:hypothetical protein [Algoriphagus aquimarinus]SFA80244.1 hypothetical protein SAMN04489723_101396 [Algoriphagus aquimarinus]